MTKGEAILGGLSPAPEQTPPPARARRGHDMAHSPAVAVDPCSVRFSYLEHRDVRQ
jgi:hypothetical protein